MQVISIELLKKNLVESGFKHYGLCIFVPALTASIVNRELNIAYGDSGDNLSVPLGFGEDNQVVKYLGANYSSANIEDTLATVDVVANITGCVLLVTYAGVGGAEKKVVALVEHGTAKPQSERVESFFSFAKNHLGVERLSNPSNDIDLNTGGIISLAAISTAPAIQTQAFLTVSWESIFRKITEEPKSLFEFANNWRLFEEFLAESYTRAGYNVELTPASNDGGVDIVAKLPGHGAIKILDQAKAYSMNRLVTANDVRAVVGTLTTHPDASKAIITTTSSFAPGVYDEFSRLTPTRLELRGGQELISWLKSIEANR